MKLIKFKTNINCNGCIKSVTPFLNSLDNVEVWKVDLKNPDKILEVELEDDNKNIIIESVKKAGFEIEEI
ncbi:MAG: heavy-metal-associated domain-containing protein [Flavobacteriaceae bacterium]